MSRLAYPGIRWDKIARLAQSGISQGNDFRLSYRGISLQRHSFHKLHSSPQLAASRRPGLMTPLRPCPDDHVAPFLGLRQARTGPRAPNARPPAPKLPQPRVELVHVAPPTAIRGGCIGCSELEHAALEVSQLVWICGESVAAFQEQ